MKKADNKVAAEKPQQKKVKKERKFFLYNEEKGFVRLDEKDPLGMPNFERGGFLTFPTRAKAVFARDFFIGVKMATSFDILVKIA